MLAGKQRDFLELNRELEDKVKSLVQEVDGIINRQEDVIRHGRRSADIHQARRGLLRAKQRSDSNSGDNNEENDDGNDNVDDDADGTGGKSRSTSATIIRFLKAQVTKLQTDVQAAQLDARKKNDVIKELEAEIKRNDEKKEKLYAQISQHKETIVRAEGHNAELQAKLQAQSAEMSALRKDIEALKKESKSLAQLASSSEVRLNRSLEEIDKLKNALKASQSEEKELRAQVRKIQEDKRLAFKNSEKQRAEIVQAFKKQTQLVDNLRKQKAYLEAAKAIQFTEDDFTRLLEWKPDK
ncbi:testis-expressed protein 9 [Trichogramma pretiosum]|uniref:testis-expressed protein 9 n=1 Tax=Trichogramma pretiosum TaxID=7493 RepID=UPI0006C982B7|nr:testis-expressed protein 9 [Trichogramma pretiosum]